jgi:hypothetical protein
MMSNAHANPLDSSAPIATVCAYGHPGCEKPVDRAPAGFRLSHGICPTCLAVERAKNMLARTSRKVAR